MEKTQLGIIKSLGRRLPIHKLTFVILLLLSGITLQPAHAQVWTLQQCIDTAQVQNKRLQTGKNNIEINEQKQKEAKANLLPKITVNADYKYFTNLPYQLMPMSVFGGQEGEFKEAQFGVPHNINAQLQMTMPLYNPQIKGAIEATKIATELKVLQYQKMEEDLYFEISNLYFNAQILHTQLIFMDSNLVNSKRLLDNVQLLREQLLAKGTDVDKIVLQLEQLSAQRQLMQSKYDQILNALKFLMGVSIDQTMEVEPTIKFQDKSGYPEKPTIDIRLAVVQQRLLLSEHITLKQTRLPSVSLFGTYGLTGFGYDKQPNEFLKFYPIGFVGLQASYPLFNGTVTQKRIKQKELELANNALQRDLLREQNHMLIENTLLQKRTAQKTVGTGLSRIQLAQSIYTQTIFQQKQRVATLTDVLLADNALHEAQQHYISTIIEYMRADMELKKLTGNLLNR